jgi:cytochrome c peroxidase
LYGITGRPSDVGRFKVPTLRNVAITSPYFHNGVTRTLKEAVHFYNARDVDPAIAPPEFPANMNTAELGNLGLTSAEEDDIVAFLHTLTDGYSAP